MTVAFEDRSGSPIQDTAGNHVVVPPARLHHVGLDGLAAFTVEVQ